MNQFNADIQTFLSTGEFENNLDSFGNVIFYTNPTSVDQSYISFKLETFNYDESKINGLYDVNFTEFIPILNVQKPSDAKSDISIENEQLKTKLSELIGKVDSSSSTTLIESSKDLIIQLRISLGQGKSKEDFTDTFPYTTKIQS